MGILDEKVTAKYNKFSSFVSYFKMKYYNDHFDQMRKRYKNNDLELIMVKKLLILNK